MAVVVRSLQDQIDKAKENLKGVDENIKKLIGRDPSDTRPGAAGAPGRRVSLGGAGPGVGRGRGAGFRRESEDWGDGPAVKRRGEIGLGARDRRVVTYRGRGRGRGRRDDEDDEDELPHKPSLASSVIPTPTAKMTRKDSIDQLNKDEQSKKRNRRMFGMLMGTLQRFRTEEVSKQQQDKERRRVEIDKKLDEKVEEEKKAAAAERQVLFKERRAKQAELRKLEYKLELAQLQEEWDRHNAHLMQFIQVKASPALFWCPKKHSKETLQLLKESQDRLKKVFDKRRKDLEEEISVMEVTAESGKTEGGAEPGEGGQEGKGEVLNVQDMDDLPEDTGIEIGEEVMDTGGKDDGKEQVDDGKEQVDDGKKELHDGKSKGEEEQGRSRRESESGRDKGKRRDSERDRKRSRSGPEAERKQSQSGGEVKKDSSETAEVEKETSGQAAVEPGVEGEGPSTEGETAVVRPDTSEEPMATEAATTEGEEKAEEKTGDWPMGSGEGDWEMVE
ncbi:PNN [Branchiostoma lanceolatum]|uniref:Pinin n=1 Tax=Branchiostoma lanceolatum TaxID=7740 RepID=A0A8J9ZUS8_BRALA|nr:PNN [Branchiostoma lanceolatum]